jgi:hypothetical protein
LGADAVIEFGSNPEGEQFDKMKDVELDLNCLSEIRFIELNRIIVISPIGNAVDTENIIKLSQLQRQLWRRYRLESRRPMLDLNMSWRIELRLLMLVFVLMLISIKPKLLSQRHNFRTNQSHMLTHLLPPWWMHA